MRSYSGGMAISRDEVLTAAMGILDTYGLGDLTMRRLATSLGVQAGALYWHFANKQTLLDALGEQILAGLPAVSRGDWRASVQVWAARLHALLRRHRSGAELVSGVLALRDWDASPARDVEALLLSVGLAPATARAAANGLLDLVLGHAASEEQQAQLAELGLRPPVEDDQAGLLDEAVSIFVAGIPDA